MNKGIIQEIESSYSFHHEGIPLLVSPSLLRSRQLGQIDLARIRKDKQGWLIELGEVKSSHVGVEQMERSQKRRLFASQQFLSGIFGHRSRLISMGNNLVGFVLVLQKFPTFINLVA